MRKMSNQSRKKWCCLGCSQRSARNWNLKVHIKRWHNGIGEPIDEEEYNKIKDMMSNQFFYHNHSYSVNYLSVENQKGKEKERDIIDEIYQMVIERKEKLRKIKEIKSFFNELSSLSSSSSQQPVTTLIQTPIIQPIIPPITTTAPLQSTQPQPAQSSQEEEQEQKMMIINPGTDLITNLFITSIFMAPDLQRRARGEGEGGEDSIIIIPQEPSLPPYIRTTTSDNNNDSKKRGVEPNPTIENTKEQEPEEDRHDIEEYDIEEHPSSKSNLFIDNENGYVINNNIDCDDSSNIDNNYDYSSDVSLVIKRDDHGDIYE
jgi:hypothetical protein